ncbi:MAG: tetratricopeptide repeat protein [Bdellovibrionales bacterium]|jgi:tetratricopeptide (TPR) repeat protein|nr:tetratricopeptide repeat protein [Bdellovibrionales bacterium]
MIEDLYSESEKPFQMAAYYNYLGELENSLRLYFEIERRVQSGESLRPVPKLNIANTLYDMSRFREALSYYRQALDEYLRREQEVVVPSQNPPKSPDCEHALV